MRDPGGESRRPPVRSRKKPPVSALAPDSDDALLLDTLAKPQVQYVEDIVLPAQPPPTPALFAWDPPLFLQVRQPRSHPATPLANPSSLQPSPLNCSATFANLEAFISEGHSFPSTLDGKALAFNDLQGRWKSSSLNATVSFRCNEAQGNCSAAYSAMPRL